MAMPGAGMTSISGLSTAPEFGSAPYFGPLRGRAGLPLPHGLVVLAPPRDPGLRSRAAAAAR